MKTTIRRHRSARRSRFMASNIDCLLSNVSIVFRYQLVISHPVNDFVILNVTLVL
jgi:hypothetical protein